MNFVTKLEHLVTERFFGPSSLTSTSELAKTPRSLSESKLVRDKSDPSLQYISMRISICTLFQIMLSVALSAWKDFPGLYKPFWTLDSQTPLCSWFSSKICIRLSYQSACFELEKWGAHLPLSCLFSSMRVRFWSRRSSTRSHKSLSSSSPVSTATAWQPLFYASQHRITMTVLWFRRV